MKIAVLVKQVADTAARIELLPDDSGVKLDGVQMVLNPYDEFAVEEAIKIKEQKGGEVVVFNIGPVSADEAVKTALAMGCERAVVLRDDAAAGLDACGIAEALSQMIKREEFDLVLCGKQAVDSDTHQVGPALAEKLGFPAATFITSCAAGDDSVVVGRDAEGITETLELKYPALLSCQKGLNEPRYPSLPGIMQAARKPKDTLTLADLGMEPRSKVVVKGYSTPPPRAEGKVLTGEIPDQVKELVQLLRNEARAV
ncbi:MAG: electron transfer flavoprotein subunit beta/FixA family protein [bacterium]|nr:electron transfer flavoprotein subunit beta/FixA family protein [bacterium]